MLLLFSHQAQVSPQYCAPGCTCRWPVVPLVAPPACSGFCCFCCVPGGKGGSGDTSSPAPLLFCLLKLLLLLLPLSDSSLEVSMMGGGRVGPPSLMTTPRQQQGSIKQV